MAFYQLDQLFARFGEADNQKGIYGFSGGHVEATAHTHDGVKCGAFRVAECALVFDDMCMADAAASAKELHARSLVFGHGGVLQVGDGT